MPNLMDEFFDHSSSPLIMVKVSPWNLNDNVLLLGDASHAVVPFYGQGMVSSGVAVGLLLLVPVVVVVKATL